ncbi:hypothetical protein [Streptomyces canus]|uniref:hypothetical protein n=1 Tax=Streptomyces canus TaxID=58343 RepID=UPI0022548DC4|nr:hypothetical protein [Streptomyces canus]MCX4856732.1 hypothetical protein [Streptomyces canus]
MTGEGVPLPGGGGPPSTADGRHTAVFGPDGTRPTVGDVLGRVTLWGGTASATSGRS